MICTKLKQIGSVQNDWYSTEIILVVHQKALLSNLFTVPTYNSEDVGNISIANWPSHLFCDKGP